MFRAGEDARISRQVTPAEYERACRAFQDRGFVVYTQELPRLDESFVIDFTKRKHEPLTGE
jgi:hypothetical protein